MKNYEEVDVKKHRSETHHSPLTRARITYTRKKSCTRTTTSDKEKRRLGMDEL